MSWPRSAFPCLAALALLAGCGQVEDREASAAIDELPVVTYRAGDLVFTGPDTIAAGPTRVRLEAPAGGLEHLAVVRLEEGHTIPEFLTAMEVHYPPYWARFLGGPNAPRAGQASEAVMELTPGNYAIVSMVLGADGLPRVRKGMIRALTIVDAGASPRPPQATAVLQLYDYGFHISAPLLPLSQVVRVENPSPQRHEVILVRLAPGHTAQEMGEYLLALAAGTATGVPPGDLEGGIGPLSQSQSNLWTVTLSRGSYALLCLLADDGDGRSHLHHGHLQQFEVASPEELLPPSVRDSAR